MSAALAQPAAAPFNTEFYSVAATLIPLLFISIAIEGRLIRDLIAANFAAVISAANLAEQELTSTPDDANAALWNDQSLSPRQKAGVVARLLFLNWIAGTVPAILAIAIIVLGTMSEITALTALHGRTARPWMGTLILTGAILLVSAAAIIPAAGIVRAIREQVDNLEQAGLLEEGNRPADTAQGPEPGQTS